MVYAYTFGIEYSVLLHRKKFGWAPGKPSVNACYRLYMYALYSGAYDWKLVAVRLRKRCTEMEREGGSLGKASCGDKRLPMINFSFNTILLVPEESKYLFNGRMPSEIIA